MELDEKMVLHAKRIGVGVAQLVSAQPSELEVPSSILGDSNACFDFLLICVV